MKTSVISAHDWEYEVSTSRNKVKKKVTAYHSCLMCRSRILEVYLHSSIRVHSVVLN
jgi:hypothetical protein